MPWTPTTRVDHNRDHLRYPSDLTDSEWQIIQLYLPTQDNHTGRPRIVCLRHIFEALLYWLRAQRQWRMLPKISRPGRPFTAIIGVGIRTVYGSVSMM